jgi:hypothetical protein
MTTTDVRSSAIEALAGRIFNTGVGAAELCTAYLGIHLGFLPVPGGVTGDPGGAGRTNRL